MPRIHSVLTSIILILLAVSLSSQEINVTGDWELTMQTQRGDRTSKIHFDQEGENLTVTMTSARGDEVKAEGTIKGNEIEWTVTRSTPRGEMTMTYKGKVEGNTMSGEVKFGDRGQAEWKATKI